MLHQAEATYYGTPRVERFELEGRLSGVDLAPLAAAATAPGPAGEGAAAGTTAGSTSTAAGGGGGLVQLEQLLGSGAPLKVKLSGRGRLAAGRNESEARRRQQLGRPSAGQLDDNYLFTGEGRTGGVLGGGVEGCRGWD